MIKRKLTIIALFSFATSLISCNSSTNSNMTGNKTKTVDTEEQIDKTEIDTTISHESTISTQIPVASKASGFVENLKAGEKLGLFFSDSWIFIYHEDNRCDGSTDGQINPLKSTQIDSIIRVQVKNDGEGWACEKKEPKTFDLDFDLKKKITDWDRVEISNDENKEDNIVYVVGAGESDYLKLHYDDNNLIITLEYRSEDPG